MKRFPLYILALLMLAVSCKSEQKVATFETLYKEQPLTILIAPVQDNARRDIEKKTQDRVLNDELTQSAQFLRQSCIQPLVSIGYYPLPILASDVILQKEGMDYKQLMLGDLKGFNTRYGIDAVLLVAVHKWKEPEINEVMVFVEYTLRSTKTGLELMHTWVRGRKVQPCDTKGEPVELYTDLAFEDLTGMNKRLAHRCLLMQGVSDFALRNIPISVSRWQFQRDKYVPSYPAFYNFTMTHEGEVQRTEYNEDAFGNECFTD